MTAKFKALLERAASIVASTNRGTRFLHCVSGVIHVGAHAGQEGLLYNSCGVRVLWIEANPDIFTKLSENIRRFKNQRAVQALVTDRDDGEYQFYISDNGGASSSALVPKKHKDVWPQVNFTKVTSMKSVTLSSLLKREEINPSDYQALCMDVQGAEMLVLHGAQTILPFLKYVKLEVADFESYEDCCKIQDVAQFMSRNGFVEIWRSKFAGKEGVGSYFDVLYHQRPSQKPEV